MIPFWVLGIFVAIAGATVISYHMLFGILIVAGGVVIIMFYIMLAPKYPVQALVFMRRRGNMRLVRDKAARVETAPRSGTFKYKLKACRGETKAALYENLYPSGKGEIAVFYSPAPGEFLQAVLNEDSESVTFKDKTGRSVTQDVSTIQPVPDNLMEWMILKQARMKQKYERRSIWEQFYPLIVIMVLAVSMVVIIHSVFQSLEPTVEGFKEAASGFNDAATKLADVAEKLALEDRQSSGTVTPIPPPPDVG